MGVLAYVLIRTHAGKAKSVAEHLSKLAGCRNVCTVTGRYDVIMLMEADSLEALGKTVVETIHKLDGIERTETAIVV
jgi:DNA-binding Lrp family transcriptional regulator